MPANMPAKAGGKAGKAGCKAGKAGCKAGKAGGKAGKAGGKAGKAGGKAGKAVGMAVGKASGHTCAGRWTGSPAGGLGVCNTQACGIQPLPMWSTNQIGSPSSNRYGWWHNHGQAGLQDILDHPNPVFFDQRPLVFSQRARIFSQRAQMREIREISTPSVIRMISTREGGRFTIISQSGFQPNSGD